MKFNIWNKEGVYESGFIEVVGDLELQEILQSEIDAAIALTTDYIPSREHFAVPILERWGATITEPPRVVSEPGRVY